MRSFRALTPLALLLLTSGCGYIHFGRLPRSTDAALQQAYADLALEHKILKQELVLAHKESDSLRAALERAGATAPSTTDLASELDRTSRELASVRAAYAKLQTERAAAADATTTMAAQETATLRDENTRLRRELDASRQQNATLADQLKASVERTQQAQASAAELDTELAAQKQARERAEQAATALRAQLEAVMARAGRADGAAVAAPAPTVEAAPTVGSAATPLSALQQAKAPPSGAAPVVELRTSLERARAAAATAGSGTVMAPSVPEVASAATATPTPSPAPATRTYTVQPGDTLEKIAVKLYGAADQWGRIYSANADALGTSQGLKPGMKLVVPEP